MSISTYYLSKREVSGVGGLFILNQLQLADSSGGGKALLGSVVKENKESFHKDYPVPLTLFTPRVLIKELTARKDELGIDGEITVQQEIAAGHEKMKIEKNDSFSLGLGPFPSIPVNAKFQIDYAKMKSIDITYGNGTFYEYIPQGYMSLLYEALGGEPTPKIGGGLLKKNSYISLLWLAKEWSVTFESTSKFDVGVDAQLSAYNEDDAVGGKVKISRSDEFHLEAKVSGDTYYLVGLMSTRWSTLKMS
jgi:hypothetical protein